MKEFTYTITDPLGLHARPASQLAQAAAKVQSAVAVSVNGKQANVKQVISLMRLCVKYGDTLTFKIEGDDEAQGAVNVEAFCRENL